MQWIDDTDDFIVIENNSVLVNYNLEKRPAIFHIRVTLQNAYPRVKKNAKFVFKNYYRRGLF